MANQKCIYKKSGDRIRFERKAAGYKSAEKFGHVLNIGRSQIEQIERGERLPDLETLVKMAKMFNCEIDYLLGNIPCKTREITDISEITGLKESTIERLKYFNTEKRHCITLDFINAFINYWEIYMIALDYRSVKEAKERYDQCDHEYESRKEEFKATETSKEELASALYSIVRENSFKTLMDFQRFLDK